MAGVEARGRDWNALARTALAGAVAAAALFGAFVIAGVPPQRASELAFSLSGLPFSVGLIGWSTVLLSGDAIERFSRDLGMSERWTTSGGRRAMAIPAPNSSWRRREFRR